MYFSVIFLNAPEGPAFSYELVFHPTPTWFQGHKEIISVGNLSNLGFKDLLNSIPKANIANENGIEIHSSFQPQKLVKIICHDGGHGSQTDLKNLCNEIKDCGFEAKVL